jgi:hypothetical protein
MKPPSKFEIMRVNRGFTDFVNEKARLMAEIDCAELHVLRTLRKRQAEEEYQRYDALDEETVPPAPGVLKAAGTPTAAEPQRKPDEQYRDEFLRNFTPDLAPPSPWWKRWSSTPRRPACR